MSRHHPAAAAARTVLPNGLAAAAFLLLALAPSGWPGYALLGLALAASWATGGSGGGRPPALGADPAVRLLLAAGVLAAAARQQLPAGEPAGPLALAGAALLGAPLLEGLSDRLAQPRFQAVRLPAAPPVSAALVAYGGGWLVSAGGLAVAGLLVWLDQPGWTLLLPAGTAAGCTGWLLIAGWRRWRTGHRAELAALTGAVHRHQPRFLLYFSAPPGSAYQARMWLPQLERIGAPFLVVLLEPHQLAPVAAATTAPVVVVDSFEAIDAVLVPSLRAAFYVNNGAKNSYCVRVGRLTHVQLYHGDSDKAVTASPVNAMYDRIFVAGRAAIDRFAAHGVEIPREKFRIVGRPQVEQLQTAAAGGRAEPPAVLYAPTWTGSQAGARHCSLPVAELIVRGLLDRGATVIFRPHPYSRRQRESAGQLRRVEQLLERDRAGTGRPHRWGPASTARLSLFEAMNHSDALVCDVSSVAADYLATGKPFAITDMAGRGDRFPAEFPLARAGYPIRADAGNLTPVLADLLGPDPLAATRRELRDYYLGDPAGFLTEARGCLTEPQGSPV